MYVKVKTAIKGKTQKIKSSWAHYNRKLEKPLKRETAKSLFLTTGLMSIIYVGNSSKRSKF